MDKKGFALIIILLIVSVVFIVGGVWYWQTHQQTLLSASINSWATYTDSQYGFSFQYPSAWGNPIVGSDTVSFASPDPNAEIPEEEMAVSIVPAQGKTLDQVVAADSAQPGVSYTDIATTTLGGVVAKSFLEHREGGFANAGIYAIHNNNVYEIFYGNWFWGDPMPSSTEISQQAISTFIFQ